MPLNVAYVHFPSPNLVTLEADTHLLIAILSKRALCSFA
jgi:hypothetical protein